MGAISTRDSATRGVLLGCVLLLLSGCGYVKNVRDDFADIFIFGVGVTPPVLPTEKGAAAAGINTPSAGLYFEATQLFAFGGMWKASRDFEIDRRAIGVVDDKRFKVGFGPYRYVQKQQKPIYTNDYKSTGNRMDNWRKHMYALKDPVLGAPAKELIYDNMKERPRTYRGWQGWEMFMFEVAIPEPFVTHSGVNVRAGFDPSEVFDFVLALVGLDLYSDDAYRLDGSLIHPPSREGEEYVPPVEERYEPPEDEEEEFHDFRRDLTRAYTR